MNQISQSVPKSTPKDVFLHLLSIVTLYASVVSFIALLWQFINIRFPDPLNFYYGSVIQSVRWSASVLVVMFPVYVLVTWLIHRDFAHTPAHREIRIRKWLVYLTLFISALTVIVDVITLVYNLFGGELTARFFLKVLVILITTAGVFGYYFYDLRRGSVRNLKIIAWVVSILVLASVVSGFLLIGSPAHQRSLSFDERKVNDLQNIQYNIINYASNKGGVPANLSELNNSLTGYFVPPTDPQTGSAYEYKKNSNLSFELCANFNLPSVSDSVSYARAPMPFMDPASQNWNHTAGRNCFERTVDPQSLNKNPPPIK